jgi:hypothetical protein
MQITEVKLNCAQPTIRKGETVTIEMGGGDKLHQQIIQICKVVTNKKGKQKPGEIVAKIDGSIETLTARLDVAGPYIGQAWEYCPVFAFLSKWVLFGWLTGYQIRQKVSNVAEVTIAVTE